MNHDTSDYDLSAIRQLLLEAFTAKDLRRFCLDDPRFRSICDRFGPGHGLADMVDVVIDYCRTRGLLPKLLAAVQQARPDVYACHEERILIDGSPADAPPSPPVPPEPLPSPDTEPPIWKEVLSNPIVWVVVAVLILLAGYCLIVYDPPPVRVALETTHGRYVTAMAGNWDPPWVLRADTKAILDCEKFTLLCQCGGQVALQTCQKTETGKGYVTAMGGDHDWLLTGKIDVKVLFERFTILDVDTEERRSCREVIKALEENDQVSVAFRTWRTKEGKRRLWTAMDGNWHQPWVIRAGTNVMGPSEIFTMTLVP